MADLLHSKTARLLGVFNRKEFPAIERFIALAPKAQSDQALPIFKFLVKQSGRGAKSKADTQALYQAMGWEEADPATTSKVNFALHQLKQLLEDYLLHDFYRRKEQERESALMAAYRERQASEFVLEASARLDKLIEPMCKGPAYYKAESELINVQFNHPYPNQFARRKYDIYDVMLSFDRQHLSIRLIHIWNMLLESIQFSGMDDAKRLRIQTALEAVTADPEFAAEPFILVYTMAIRSVLEGAPDFATFEQIRAAADRILPYAPDPEVMGLMNLQINYLIHLQSVSATPYSEALLERYQLGLDNGGLFKDGYLSYGDFMNMINISARINRLDWATALIADYGHRLNPEIRDQVLPLARARILYFKGDPAAALRLLNPSRKALNDADKLFEKLLRTYCYYELGQDDLLDAHVEAFRKFILRHQNLNEVIRKPVSEFLRLLRRLLQATDAEQLRALQTELVGMPSIYPFEWLGKQTQLRLDRLN